MAKTWKLKLFIRFVLCGSLMLAVAPAISKSETDSAFPIGLFSLTLQELLNIEISVASREQSKAFDNPAAVYVITQADINASGLKTIPDLLRMVPGLHVDRLSGGQWAVSARNKTRRFSGYLLIAIDGRAVHNPVFGGVLWDMQHYPIEDIEKIEIVRGPGATTWGTNATNGVINIISKNSRATQGTLVSLGGGRGELTRRAVLRHGFTVRNTKSSLYFMQQKNDSGDIPGPTKASGRASLFEGAGEGEDGKDDASISQMGFRLDYPNEKHQWLIKGDYFQGETSEYDGTPGQDRLRTNEVSGANLLARFQHQSTDDNETVLQVYFDHIGRNNKRLVEALDRYEFDVDTTDIDLQHYHRWRNHRWSLGLGYRLMEITPKHQGLMTQNGILMDPDGESIKLPSAYIQDTIGFWKQRLQLTLGVKAERNEYSGSELSPSIRLLWNINAQQNLWFAYTRSSKTPAIVDTQIYADDPDLAALDASAAACEQAGASHRFGFLIVEDAGCVQSESLFADSQKVLSREMGYRHQWQSLAVDLAVFYDKYDLEEFITDTDQRILYGAELSFNYHVSDNWQILFNASRHQGTDQTPNGKKRYTTEDISKNTRYLRLSYHPSQHWLFYSNIYYVDDTLGPVPAYTRVDLQAQWLLRENFSLSLLGTNLQKETHLEKSALLFDIIPTEARRRFFVNLSYEF